MVGRGERRTASDRAQTAQDFALGVGFFVIAVAFVFAFIPSMLTFTTADPGVKAAKQADMASSGLVRSLAAESGEPGRVNGTMAADYFNASGSEAALQSDLALPNTSFVNVTLRSIDGEDVVNLTDSNGNQVSMAAGREYRRGLPAAEVARVLTVTEDGGTCDPACQLVVRVW